MLHELDDVLSMSDNCETIYVLLSFSLQNVLIALRPSGCTASLVPDIRFPKVLP